MEKPLIGLIFMQRKRGLLAVIVFCLKEIRNIWVLLSLKGMFPKKAKLQRKIGKLHYNFKYLSR